MANDRTNQTDTSLCTKRLPCPALAERWNRLIFPKSFKERLLKYFDVYFELTQLGVSDFGLAQQRSLLFYGESGGGKTSLAIALPNEWATRNNTTAFLIQPNIHALPSGQYGGTQKNLLQLFNRIGEIATLGRPTFVVINEIDALATSRPAINSETNPRDTHNSVNALLESLDKLREEFKNVVFIYTSNIPRDIDGALQDRVDESFHIPLPNVRCRALILDDALKELKQISVVPRLTDTYSRNGHPELSGLDRKHVLKLLDLTDGFSARKMRRLVVSALTYRTGATELRITHLIAAAHHEVTQAQDLSNSGGVYVDDYQRRIG